mmetsp:Transcript_41270/g.95232  ORF Transcript_41270/g.95232 Transcript_41270/m.95232 type:complete len:240 (-) Transcript_41270:221-940(-)
MAQGQRRRNNGPRAEVSAGLLHREARVGCTTWAMLAAHLEHVGVRPAARLRETGLGEFGDRGQVREDTLVRRAHVTARAVEVPRAPVLGRHGLAPVAVLDHDRFAGGVDKIGPQVEIALGAASVEFDGVKAELVERIHVALVARDAGLLLVVIAVAARVRADTVVAVPTRGETEFVGLVGHGDKVRKDLMVDHRSAKLVVVSPLVRTVRAALLPVVVESHIAVAEVAERRRHPVHQPCL